MLERDEAADALQRLAEPTIAAFTEARQHYSKYQADQKGVRDRMAIPVSAVADGVLYWAQFATFLDERYSLVPGVERLAWTHPLAHQWSIDETIVVQLKSDTGNLPLDQLVIPGMREIRGVAREHVVLTWDHDHVDRFDPSFVQLDGKQEAWRVPVASLIDVVPPSVKPSQTKTHVSSKRPAAAKPKPDEQVTESA